MGEYPWIECFWPDAKVSGRVVTGLVLSGLAGDRGASPAVLLDFLVIF